MTQMKDKEERRMPIRYLEGPMGTLVAGAVMPCTATASEFLSLQ
jgi:hypothetical protein